MAKPGHQKQIMRFLVMLVQPTWKRSWFMWITQLPSNTYCVLTPYWVLLSLTGRYLIFMGTLRGGRSYSPQRRKLRHRKWSNGPKLYGQLVAERDKHHENGATQEKCGQKSLDLLLGRMLRKFWNVFKYFQNSETFLLL